jgi:hypothetical protein
MGAYSGAQPQRMQALHGCTSNQRAVGQVGCESGSDKKSTHALPYKATGSHPLLVRTAPTKAEELELKEADPLRPRKLAATVATKMDKAS